MNVVGIVFCYSDLPHGTEGQLSISGNANLNEKQITRLFKAHSNGPNGFLWGRWDEEE